MKLYDSLCLICVIALCILVIFILWFPILALLGIIGCVVVVIHITQRAIAAGNYYIDKFDDWWYARANRKRGE